MFLSVLDVHVQNAPVTGSSFMKYHWAILERAKGRVGPAQ
jgi:hypothetical protein